ncbi:MAG: alpha/beta hydrolase [Nevskia sp.]|nr:alpha/beta hydrolase [Nevskia sp.]
MAEATLNGVRLAYQQLGEGPDLVLVHGLAASRAFWFLHYAMPLARHFRVTLYDLRGHGYSERPQSGYDAVTMAGDLAALLDHLRIASCALVGHSYGGSVALEYAARQPQRVSHLALLDSKINRLQPEQKLSDCPHLSAFEREVAGGAGHDWENETQVGLLFLDVLARWRVAGGEAANRDAFTPFGEGRGAVRAARQWLDLVETTRARKEFVLPGAEAGSIAALNMPLLLVYAEHSRCLSSYHELRRLLPQAEAEVVPQGGHFFPISHVASLRPRLLRFLGVEAPATAADPS